MHFQWWIFTKTLAFDIKAFQALWVFAWLVFYTKPTWTWMLYNMKRKESPDTSWSCLGWIWTNPRKCGNNISGEKHPVPLQAITQHSALTNISAFPKDFIFTSKRKGRQHKSQIQLCTLAQNYNIVIRYSYLNRPHTWWIFAPEWYH